MQPMVRGAKIAKIVDVLRKTVSLPDESFEIEGGPS